MAKSVFGSYRSLSSLALIVGIATVVLQFLPGFELLSFMLSVTTLGSLVGAEASYQEVDRRRLAQSYKFTVERLLLAAIAAYALIEVSKWLGIMQGAVTFLNAHWPGLILSALCLFMGLAGVRKSAGGAPQTNDLRRPSV